MAKPSEKSIINAGLRALKRKSKLDDLIVLGVDEDVVGGRPVYRVNAASSSMPNAERQATVVNDEGKEVDVEALAKREERRPFEHLEPVVKVGEVPQDARPALVLISPSENILALKPGDMATETVTVKIPHTGAVPKVDVYFLADTTASMTSILSAVQAGANNILSSLNGLGLDFFYGVGNYKDFQSRPPKDPFCFQHQQSLTNIGPAVTSAIDDWTAGGGADGPEGQLFALHKLAEPPGGGIGWRSDARKIVVWFGDFPGHDPICPQISGEPAPITEASVTAKLSGEQFAILAISVLAPGLDDDPAASATDYTPLCGPPGGTPGQGTRIANATGGQFVSGINAANIVTSIISMVKEAVGTIGNVTLVPTGGTGPFVQSVSPSGGYGPLAGDEDHTLAFEVVFKSDVPCEDADQVFTGTLDVVADGNVIAPKKVQITVPACADRFVYTVKFICGEQPECSCDCTSVRPGIYATEINLHNYHDVDVEVVKSVTPLTLAGAPVGREPRHSGPRAEHRIVLPAHSATMDDCCRIAEMVLGGKPGSSTPLTIGFLEVASTDALLVTAVYTVSNLAADSVSIDVEQVPPVRGSGASRATS
jgi:hypothetical protein